jgi:hypothetical protein
MYDSCAGYIAFTSNYLVFSLFNNHIRERSMKYTILLLVTFVYSLLSVAEMSATLPEKTVSTGREFWICFQKNYRDFDPKTRKKMDSLVLQLVLHAEKNTLVIVGTALGDSKTYHLTHGKPLWISIDSALQVQSSGLVQPLSIHITADNPITVHGVNQRFQTTDSFTAFPVECLGKECRVVGYDKLSDDLLSQCAVIATKNNTRVTITPSVKTRELKPAAVPFVVTLNRGDVYQIIPAYDPDGSVMCDLTGTLIQADNAIAVFSGHNCAYVPFGVAACNHLVEQLLPTSSWGHTYYVGMLAQRSAASVRVIAHDSDTRIMVNGEEVAVLGKGEYYTDNRQKEHLLITADKPVAVAQYNQGFKNGDSIGDPMMMMIRSVETFQKEYRFVPPVRGNWQHFVNVVVLENALSSLQLNGKRIDVSLFNRCGREGYMIGQVPVSGETAHVLTCDEPFGISCYGYDKLNYDAYGNM